MITFYCVGGRAESAIVLEKVSLHTTYWPLQYVSIEFNECVYLLSYEQLRVFALAESLGAVESLAECPSLMTHASVPDDQRALLGIDDTLIRLSVGIESCSDLIADLDFALNAAVASMAKN